MNTRIIAFVLLFGTTRLVAAQPDAHNVPAQGGNTEQQVSACVRSQQVSLSLADAADRRIELARQTNQPSSMRAAIDDVQAALSAIRTQLASCTQLQSNAATADPNAGHTMNMSAPGRVKEPAPAPGKLVARPGSPAAAPTSDAHAGHVMPAPAAKALAAPVSGPQAGHTMPGMPSAPAATRGAAPKSSAPAAPTPRPGTKAPAANPDPHAGHTMSGAPASAAEAVDPVCGLKVDRASAPQATYQGQTYYFCSEQHRQSFTKDSAKYAPKVKH